MRLLIFSILASAALAVSAQLEITASPYVEVNMPASMGYTKAYVIQNGADARLSYRADVPGATWARFSNLGAAYAEPVTVQFVTDAGRLTYVMAGQDDMGYIVSVPGQAPVYFWVVNYQNHIFDISALDPDSELTDCGRTVLRVTGTADAIDAYSINGRPEVIDRDIQVTYQTLEYDAEAEDYRQITKTERLKSVGETCGVPAPLCDTRFTMTPDRFARQWYPSIPDVTSPSVNAMAVEAHTTAQQAEVINDNEQKTEGAEGSLGGSAPCEITFKAAVTDAAIYRRWEVSTYPEFDDVELTYDQLEFTTTFSDAGTRYVRFVANNAAGTCEYAGETYTVNIGESRLLCPNAFSPGASEGVNDEWKVSYRSIVDFDCQIFNRWGKRLATLSHPSQGWDGKVGGKVVPAGVYFYVIKARGADGKAYNLSGDINVINSNRTGSATAPSDPAAE